MALLTIMYFDRDIPKDARQVVLSALEKNNSRRTASKLAQVSPTRLTEYLAAAKRLDEESTAASDIDLEEYNRHEQDLISFYRAVQAAEARAETALVGHISRAASDDWKAAAHILKQRNPEDWAESRTTAQKQLSILDESSNQTTNPLTNPANLDLNLLTVEEVIELERLLTKASGKSPVEDAIEVPPRAAPKQITENPLPPDYNNTPDVYDAGILITHSTTRPLQKVTVLP